MRLKHGINPHPNPDIYKWSFNIENLEKQGFPQDYLKDGSYTLEVGFDGKYIRISDISIDSKGPAVESSLRSIPGRTKDKILEGWAADERQDPREIIKVDIVFFNNDSETTTPLPVERKVDNSGRIYFHFKTSIRNLPQLSPDDPAYNEKFFGFRVTDQAGNSYRHVYDYAQFASSGMQHFGVNRIADIQINKHRDIESQTFDVSFTIKPSSKSKTKYKDKPALTLKVFAHTKNETRLEYKKGHAEIVIGFRDCSQICGMEAPEGLKLIFMGVSVAVPFFLFIYNIHL